MAAAVSSSPWGKPGAWALEAEENEAELLKEQQKQQALKPDLPGDFPSLSAAVAAPKSKKKNKGQKLSLGEFATYTVPKQTDELIELPTGPRERSAEELDRSRLGGGFRSYGSGGRYGGGGDESSKDRWGSAAGGSRVSDEGGRRPRDANRDSGPSRADEIDNWAAAKKSTFGGGGFDKGNSFDRRERTDRGGFFDTQSKADESDNWVSNKSVDAPPPRRFGASNGGGFDRKSSFDSLSRNRDSVDADSWGKRREETNGGSVGVTSRPRLVLQPRTLPVTYEKPEVAVTVEKPHEEVVIVEKPKGVNPFGSARPREEVLAEKGKDWKEIDEKLEAVKLRDVGKRSFSVGKQDEPRSWRKSVEKTESEHAEDRNEEVEATNGHAEAANGHAEAANGHAEATNEHTEDQK